MSGLIITPKTRRKLIDKHGVSEQEIIECFGNRDASHQFLKDSREHNQTTPPSLWFIAETDKGRTLKIVFISEDTDMGKSVTIKTAYPPNETEVGIYRKFGHKQP